MACDYNISNIDEDPEFTDLHSFTATTTTLIAFFFIGLYIQIKIIIVSMREKGVNWKVNIVHSIVMITFFGVRISFEIVTYFIPSLHLYTGSWFCYLTLFVNQFGAASLLSHSLVVAIYKYIYVMHNDFILSIGENKASSISALISILLPLVLGTSFTARPSSFLSYSSVLNCLAMTVEKDTHAHVPWSRIFKNYFTCGFVDSTDHKGNNLWNQVINVITILGCSLTSALLVLILLNIFEVICYCRLFAFARR